MLVIDCAGKNFGLHAELKLGVYHGSDKFSIYPVRGRLLKQYDKWINV